MTYQGDASRRALAAISLSLAVAAATLVTPTIEPRHHGGGNDGRDSSDSGRHGHGIGLGLRRARADIEDQPSRRPEPAQAAADQPTPQLTQAPELRQFIAAEYPAALLDQGIGGEVMLWIDIAADGTVERVEVESASHPAFAQPAINAARAFIFSPAHIDGQPGAVRIAYRYIFEPQLRGPTGAGAGGDGAANARSEREPEPESEPEPEPEPEPDNFVGVVREAGSRRPIAGALVSIDAEPRAQTDAAGRFALRVAAGVGRRVHLVGPYHEPYDVTEDFAAGTRLEATYYLFPKSTNPYETLVRTRAARREAAKVELERREVERVPGTFGDPVRVIENLPGLARTPGGLGGALIVRGTQPTDTGVYMDGVQIPLLYHFGGLTSVVNAEFLDRVDFFAGGFGARYGRATAGVADVVTRELDCEMVHGSAEVDLLDSSAYACVPIGASWRLGAAARRSYIDLWLPAVLDKIPREPDEGVVTAAPVYWDYQVKAQGKLGGGGKSGAHALELFAFGADDVLKLVQSGSVEDLNFDFRLHLAFHRLLLRHSIRLGADSTLVTAVAPGLMFQELLGAADEIELEHRFELRNATLDWREEFTHRFGDRLTLRAGLDHSFGGARLDLQFPIDTDLSRFPSPTFDFTRTDPFHTQIDAYNQGYWLELAIEPGGGLSLTPGVRLDRFDFHRTQRLALMPRMTARWELHPGSVIKAAYGLYKKLPEPQFLIESIGNPDLDPEQSQHFIIGAEQDLPWSVNVDLQAFYNLRSHLPTPSDATRYAAGRAVAELWKSEQTGHVVGVELLLRRQPCPGGRFYGWVAYTLSRSVVRDTRQDLTYQLQGGGDNDGRGFDTAADTATTEKLSPFDQTHILTVVGQWELPWGIGAGLRFRLVSGNPQTPLRAGTAFYDADADRYRLDLGGVERNSTRLPAFHQLDVRVEKTFTFDWWRFTTYLEVINAYWAKNVESYSYDYRFEQRSRVTFLPVVPILGVKGEF